MATAARKRTSTRRPTRNKAGEAPNAHLDNPLYLPRLDLLELGARALAGAGPEYSEILESICGTTDDSQPVEQYDGTLGVTTAFVNAHQKQAIQVQWNDNLGTIFTNPGDVNGVRWGSGTMISANLMLTCGHLFDADPNGWTVPRQNGTSTAISPQEVATNMHVNFLYQVDPSGTLRAEQRFPITQLVEYRLGGLDMAICRIGGNPGNTYGWTEVSATNPVAGEMLAILGHPAGHPKRIEAGPCTSISSTTVRYNDIDTLGGNSGSGILQASTGRVVGVHTNGGCNSAGTGTNSGTAIAAIRAASPTLQALPASSQTAAADDNIATTLAADVHATLQASDTIRALDQLQTTLAADVLGTLRAADTVRAADIATIRALDTARAADLLGTTLAGDVFTSAAADDPNNTLREVIVDPGDFIVDPPFLGGLGGLLGSLGGGLRPLVLAGASALDAVGGEGVEGQEGGGVIAQLETVVEAQRAVLASLEMLLATLVQIAE
jgi:V8-like Glu-specific endopeptidase